MAILKRIPKDKCNWQEGFTTWRSSPRWESRQV